MDVDFKLLQAIAALLMLLSAATLITRKLMRLAPDHALVLQVQAWWYLLPIASAAALLFPAGADALAAIIILLALSELAKLHPNTWHFWLTSVGVWLLADLIARVDKVLFVESSWRLACLWVAITLWTMVQAWRQLVGDFNQVPSKRLENRSSLLVWLAIVAIIGLSTSAWFDRLDHVPAQRWFFYLLALTAINDVAQFVVGSRWGGLKILPKISPNKSWQGLLSGVLCSTMFSVLLGRHLALQASAKALQSLELAALGAALAVLGFCGDGLYSAGKRVLGIKDYSALIPGHGGMLDRADSLILTAPALYFWLQSYAPAR